MKLDLVMQKFVTFDCGHGAVFTLACTLPVSCRPNVMLTSDALLLYITIPLSTVIAAKRNPST